MSHFRLDWIGSEFHLNDQQWISDLRCMSQKKGIHSTHAYHQPYSVSSQVNFMKFLFKTFIYISSLGFLVWCSIFSSYAFQLVTIMILLMVLAAVLRTLSGFCYFTYYQELKMEEIKLKASNDEELQMEELKASDGMI